MKEYLLIIDGSSLLSTQFYGNLPPVILGAKTPEEKEKHFHRIMQTSKGQYTNAVFGFLRTLLKMLEVQKPTHLAVTWDLTRDTFRREMYADYKANRSEVMVPLKEQFALCQEVLARMGVKQYMDMRYEADDFSGSLNRTFSKEVPVCILTKDHDYLQLAGENTTIWLLHSNQSKADELFTKYHMKKEACLCPEKTFPLTPELIKKEYGVEPSSVASLKGLQGDSSDNIKGVPGIGPQTATALIGHYKSVAKLYEAIHTAGADGAKELASRWKEELGIKRNPINFLCKESETELVGEKAAFLSEKLATIYTEIPIEETLDQLAVSIDWNALKQVLHELEITTIALPDIAKEAEPKVECKVHDIDNLDRVEELFFKLSHKTSPVGISMEKTMDMVTVVLAEEEELYRIACQFFITPELISERLYELCEVRPVAGFYIREMGDVLPRYHKNILDLSLMDYLLRPLDTHHEPKVLALEWAPTESEPADLEAVAHLATVLAPILTKQLKEKECEPLYYDVEQPLIWVLTDMEQAGIRVDMQQLKEFAAELLKYCKSEEQVIYELAGEQFNINSPKQLGEILFGKLGIPAKKKTKSGYSTSADILENLRQQYPIVDHVLQYRQYAKLYSTYAEGLQTCVAEDGRIHTTFQQMVTATGRLSSTEPNLQNIPVRTELGRLIRKVFVPAEGCRFVDADYSQIELRLMAHMSGDQALIDAYKQAEDIHRLTAGQVFGVPYEEVTKEQRSAAKAVNFGILYGISSFSLSQDLGITVKMAEEYIQRYFERYPNMKAYLDNSIEQAKQEGYVRTLFGRIRPIPELASGNYVQRSFGERVAMNSPIQGTAADIIKIAMLRVAHMLQEHKLKTRLLVQVHDELLLEAPEDEVEQVVVLLKEAMEQAVHLSVPLEVEVNTGLSWYDAK